MSLRGPLSLILFSAVAFQLNTLQGQAQTTVPADSFRCPVTVPNESQPPVKNFGGTVTYSPDYTGPRDVPTPNSYGNGKIWTVLWPNGTVIFRPGGSGFILEDGSLAMKWLWFRAIAGRLRIEGKRLDASAPPLRASIPDGYRGTGIQASGLIFPTEGCWEVTGRVADASLTFVTRVVRVEQVK